MADKVQLGKVMNATIQINNLSDTKRKFNISADIVVKNKACSAINNGQVADKSDGSFVGYFNKDNNGFINVSFVNNEVSNVSVLESINDFIENVVNYITTISTETVL